MTSTREFLFVFSPAKSSTTNNMNVSWGLHVIAALLFTSYAFGRRPMENKGMFEGDIAGIDPYVFLDRNAAVDVAQLWPNGIVHYEIDPRLKKAEDVIKEAFKEYETKTCLKFRPKTPKTKDYVKLFIAKGCWADIGRHGGKQNLSLGEGCQDKVTVVHELGHTIGFWHEHARSDRDDYLEILWKNIEKGEEHNFIKRQPWENNLLGEKFDFDSVMLYDSYSFSKDPKLMTMKPKEEGRTIELLDNKPGLSVLDAIKINKLYECFGNKRPPPPDVPDFECDFETTMCGISNDEDNEDGEWSVYRSKLGGRTTNYLAVYAKDGATSPVRVNTETFEVYGRKKGCLQFDVYLNGDGALALDVIGHSGGFAILMASHTQKKDAWQTIKRELQFPGNIQFTLEARTHPDTLDKESVVALDNIRFSLRECGGKS